MHHEPPPAQTLRRSTLALLAFWLVLGVLLWTLFAWHEARIRAALRPYAPSVGELRLARSADGHFYVDGEVNGVPVHFMVDTGASHVVVSREAARAAHLPPGVPITVGTAGGTVAAHVVHGVPVKAGSLTANGCSVDVGLTLGHPRQALLGQSFLRHFSMSVDGQHMTLRALSR